MVVALAPSDFSAGGGAGQAFKAFESAGLEAIDWLLLHASAHDALESVLLLSILPPDYELLPAVETGPFSSALLQMPYAEELREAREGHQEERRRAADASVARAVQRLQTGYPGALLIETHVLQGSGGGASGVAESALQWIEAHAREVDVVLTGSRGLGDVGRELVDLLGRSSVSDWLAERCPVPLLIVNHKKPAAAMAGPAAPGSGGPGAGTETSTQLTAEPEAPSTTSPGPHTAAGEPDRMATTPLSIGAGDRARKASAEANAGGVCVLLDGAPQSLEALRLAVRLHASLCDPSDSAPLSIVRCRPRRPRREAGAPVGADPGPQEGIGTGSGEAAGLQLRPRAGSGKGQPEERTEAESESVDEEESEEEDDPVAESAAQYILDETAIVNASLESLTPAGEDLNFQGSAEEATTAAILNHLRSKRQNRPDLPAPFAVVMGARGCSDVGKEKGGSQSQALPGMEGLGAVSRKLMHELLGLGPVAIVRKM